MKKEETKKISRKIVGKGDIFFKKVEDNGKTHFFLIVDVDLPFGRFEFPVNIAYSDIELKRKVFRVLLRNSRDE